MRRRIAKEKAKADSPISYLNQIQKERAVTLKHHSPHKCRQSPTRVYPESNSKGPKGDLPQPSSIQQRDNKSFQIRQVFLAGLPDNLCIHARIIMYENISHINYITDGNLRMSLSKIVAQVVGRFTRFNASRLFPCHYNHNCCIIQILTKISKQLFGRKQSGKYRRDT